MKLAACKVIQKGFILFIILLITTIALGPLVSGAVTDEIKITDNNDSVKAVEPGKEIRYEWVLTNDGETNCTVRVRVILPEIGTHWNIDIKSEEVFTLTTGKSSKVSLTASPDSKDAHNEVDIVVLFSVSSEEGDFDVQRVVKAEKVHDTLIFETFKNPLPAPLDNEVGGFLLSLVIWIVITLILTLFITFVIKRLSGKTRIKLDDIIVNAVRGPLILMVALYGILSSLKLLSIPTNVIYWLELVYNIILIINVMYVSVKILTTLVNAGIKLSERMNEPSISKMLLPMTRRIGSAIIVVVGIFIILNRLGLDITFFITSMGVVGIVVAFAAQDTLSNIFAGLHLMLDQSFKIGDRILLPQKIGTLYSSWGDVLRIGLRSTKVKSTDGIILTIPNKMITENFLANFSHLQEPSLRVRIRFGLVPTWKNVSAAERILNEITNGNPEVQEKPRAPQVILREFGDFDVVIEVRFYVDSPKKMRTVKSELLHEILKRFEEENVFISTPMNFNVESNIEPGGMGYDSLSKYCSSYTKTPMRKKNKTR
ncbi:MAG: mechanosensitive ion channel [Candidatus Thermoplasmatota archaeon]|jgi:MscS family membrane protein|nr:mechanosensitive ion channel [Candidatus Thermoplasmatota archaeon]